MKLILIRGNPYIKPFFKMNPYINPYSSILIRLVICSMTHQGSPNPILPKSPQVGAPGDNDRGDFSGAAYVFLRKADSFEEQAPREP